jgi:hypothetical protein
MRMKGVLIPARCVGGYKIVSCSLQKILRAWTELHAQNGRSLAVSSHLGVAI